MDTTTLSRFIENRHFRILRIERKHKAGELTTRQAATELRAIRDQLTIAQHVTTGMLTDAQYNDIAIAAMQAADKRERTDWAAIMASRADFALAS
jgi:hypothetical protein